MKKLLVVLAVLAGIVLSGCVGDNDMAEPVVFVLTWDTDHHEMRSYSAKGEFVDKFNIPDMGIDQGSGMCVDKEGNCYIIWAPANTIRKYSKSGSLLLTKSTYLSMGIAIGPDDYIYELGGDENYDASILKRDPDTLNIIDKSLLEDDRCDHHLGLACDSDGYFYFWAYAGGQQLITKWSFEEDRAIASHPKPAGGIECMAVSEDLLGMCTYFESTSRAYTMLTRLDQDAIPWVLDGLSIYKGYVAMSIIDNDFLVAGWDIAGDVTKVVRYTHDRVKVWEIEVGPLDDTTIYKMAAYTFTRDKESPWDEDIVEPTGEVKVEIPRRSGQWTALEDVMRIHTSNGKNPFTAVEIGQAEVTCCNISKNFNSFEEASDWYKNLEGYATQISLGCNIGGSPISVKLFTGIIKAVHPVRLTQTAEIKVIDFLDYLGRVTIEETPVWESISLTQLFKNLVELAFPEWTEGVDYFVEDLGGSTIPAIGYTDLNLLSELKMIAESRGKRLYTDTSGRLHCATRNPERDPLTVSYNYNLEDVRERRDIDSILNWIVVHARPYQIKPDLDPPGKISGFTATPGDQKIDLTWNNPTDDDFVKVMIRYSTTAYPLNIDDGTFLYEGTGESKEHTGLTNGTKYYYSAWTVDDKDNWSGAAHTSGVAGVGGDTWGDETGPSKVSQFTATPEHSKIILTWYNPNLADFEKVVIRRSTSSYPDSPTSGSAEYDGTAETHTDTGLTNGTRYYYSAFVKNTAGDYSGAAFASAIPAGPRKTIQTQAISGYGILGPRIGAYGTSYRKKVLLAFRGLGGKYSTDWLRFKHEWDIKVNSGPSHSSNQKHVYGEAADLALGFTANIGGVAGVTVTKVRVTTSEVQVEYNLTYIGGKALSISLSNKLSLRG